LLKSKETLLSLLISTAIATAILGSSELALRVIFPNKILKVEKKDPLYRFDKDLSITLKPNMRINSEGVLFTTNENSFRGNSFMNNPEMRIMVYGDSNVMGRFYNLEQTFPYKLEKYLRNALGKTVEVINAGVVGYGPDQYLIKFEKEAELFKPDLVIFVIFADNDYGDIIRNRLFELDDEMNLVRSSHPNSVDQVLQSQNSLKEFLASLLVVRAAKKIVKPPAKEIPEEDRLIAKSDQEFSIYKNLKPRKTSHFDDHYDIDVALFPKNESSIKKIQLMNAVLKRAQVFASSKNIKFLVLILPSKIDLSSRKKPPSFSYEDLKKYPEYARTNLTKPLEEICISDSTDHINLYDTYFQNDPDGLYRDEDDHWNESGEDLAAKTASDFIVSKKILERV